MTSRDPKHAFTSRPRDVETWVRASDVTTQKNGTKARHFTARLTIDVTPDLRGRIKVAAFRRRMSDLTHVELLWIKKHVENRIRFGRIVDQHAIDRQWRVVSFEAGSIFAFVRWAGNEYGTTLSRIDILRAVAS